MRTWRFCEGIGSDIVTNEELLKRLALAFEAAANSQMWNRPSPQLTMLDVARFLRDPDAAREAVEEGERQKEAYVARRW
jgi:hypothetical protein